MKLRDLRESDVHYSTILGLSLPVDPGDYLLMEKAEWNAMREALLRRESMPDIHVLSLELKDDSAWKMCEYCGAYVVHEVGCPNE